MAIAVNVLSAWIVAYSSWSAYPTILNSWTKLDWYAVQMLVKVVVQACVTPKLWLLHENSFWQYICHTTVERSLVGFSRWLSANTCWWPVRQYFHLSRVIPWFLVSLSYWLSCILFKRNCFVGPHHGLQCWYVNLGCFLVGSSFSLDNLPLTSIGAGICKFVLHLLTSTFHIPLLIRYGLRSVRFCDYTKWLLSIIQDTFNSYSVSKFSDIPAVKVSMHPMVLRSCISLENRMK